MCGERKHSGPPALLMNKGNRPKRPKALFLVPRL